MALAKWLYFAIIWNFCKMFDLHVRYQAYIGKIEYFSKNKICYTGCWHFSCKILARYIDIWISYEFFCYFAQITTICLRALPHINPQICNYLANCLHFNTQSREKVKECDILHLYTKFHKDWLKFERVMALAKWQ